MLMLVNATIQDLTSTSSREIQAYKDLCREGKRRPLSLIELQNKEYLRADLKSKCDEAIYYYYSYGIDTPPEDFPEEKQSSLLTRIRNISYEGCHLISQQQDKINQAQASGVNTQAMEANLKGQLKENYYIRPNNFSASKSLNDHFSKSSARLALNLDPEYIPALLEKMTKLFQGEFAEIISQYKVMSMSELASSMDKIIVYLNQAGQFEKARKLANHIHTYIPTEAWGGNIPLSMEPTDPTFPGIAYGEISRYSKSLSYGDSRAEAGTYAICDL